jgi:hypothetical protein
LATPQTWAFDVETGQELSGPLPAAVSGSVGGLANATAFYLTVEGMDGGVDHKVHQGAYAVEDFVFDASRLIASGGGGGSGFPDFEPLVVDLAPGAHLGELFGAAADGEFIQLVSLQGDVVSAKGEVTVYDLRLGDVLVKQVTDTSGVDHLEFVYSQVSLSTQELNADGSLDPVQTWGFDVAANQELPGPLSEANPGSGDGAANASEFYLTLTGMDGGVTTKGHENSFAVADFQFDVSQLISMGGGGGSAGAPDFAPLVVDLEPGAHLNGLLDALASGQTIDALTLQGDVISGLSGPQTVYDLSLSDVVVTRVTDTNGEDHLEFGYSAVSLTTHELNPDGSLGAPHTWEFDVELLGLGSLV